MAIATSKEGPRSGARLSKSPPERNRALGIGAVAAGLGLLLAALYLAPEAATLGIAALGLGVPAVVLLWRRPEFGLIGLIFLTSSFLPSDLVDIRLPIGGGLKLNDVVLLGLLGLVVFREIVRGRLGVPFWPAGGILLLFLGMAAFSTYYAISYHHTEAHWALSDLRILMGYVTFFIVLWAVERRAQLKTLLLGLFIVADLTTVVVYMQQFLGVNNPILQAMTQVRDWRVYAEAGGAVRVVPAGHVLMHVMWLVALALLLVAQPSRRLRNFLIGQLVFIGGGHLLAFTRAQWIALGAGIILMAAVLVPVFRENWNGWGYRRYRKNAVAFAGVGLVLVGLVAGGAMSGILAQVSNNAVVSSIGDRAGSILTPTATAESDSLLWRTFENEKATLAIQKEPLTGVGLGSRYRSVTTFQGEALGWFTRGSIAADEVSRFTRYVHNSYMSIAVKMGLPGLLVFLAFFGACLLIGFQRYRIARDAIAHDPAYKAVLLGVLIGAASLLVWSYYHPHLIKAESTPVVGLALGMLGIPLLTNRRAE